MNLKIAVIGNISRDTVSYKKERKKTFWGGGGLNISVAISRLGKKAFLYSVLGNDAVEVLEMLKGMIDVTFIKLLDGKTCHFAIKYSPNGNLLNVRSSYGVAKQFNASLLDFKPMAKPIHYHICCRSPLNPHLILPKLNEHNISYSLDFIKSSARRLILESKKWITGATYVFVNSDEYSILKNLANINDLKKVIVTSGSEPVKVFEFGKKVLEHACPKKEFNEVTGAGDVFAGTFLAMHLHGKALTESIARAIMSAQKSLDNPGSLLIH